MIFCLLYKCDAESFMRESYSLVFSMKQKITKENAAQFGSVDP